MPKKVIKYRGKTDSKKNKEKKKSSKVTRILNKILDNKQPNTEATNSNLRQISEDPLEPSYVSDEEQETIEVEAPGIPPYSEATNHDASPSSQNDPLKASCPSDEEKGPIDNDFVDERNCTIDNKYSPPPSNSRKLFSFPSDRVAEDQESLDSQNQRDVDQVAKDQEGLDSQNQRDADQVAEDQEGLDSRNQRDVDQVAEDQEGLDSRNQRDVDQVAEDSESLDSRKQRDVDSVNETLERKHPSHKAENSPELSLNKTDSGRQGKTFSEKKENFLNKFKPKSKNKEFSQNDKREHLTNDTHVQISPRTRTRIKQNSTAAIPEQKNPSKPPISTVQLKEFQSYVQIHPSSATKQECMSQNSNISPNLNDLSSRSPKSVANNCKVEEVKNRTLSKPTVFAEHMKDWSFPNCPSQDLNESEQLTAKIKISEQSSSVVTKSPNSDSKTSSEVVTKSPNSDSEQSSKIVTKYSSSDSGKSLITKESLPPDFSENASEEIFFDAPEDTQINQPSAPPIFWKTAKKGIEPLSANVKSKWHNFSKKNPAPDPNKLFCSDKKQYIKKKIQNGILHYSAKFLSHYNILVAGGEVSYEILGKRNLIIADCDNFVARIKIAPGEELDFTKSFRHNKTTLVKRVTIFKVLEDELLVQRNEAYNLFKKILEARSENISDFQDFAEDFLQISIMLKTYHSYDGRPLLLLQEVMKNQFISSELKAITEHLLNFETRLQKRNKLFPTCTCPSYFMLRDIFATMQDICKSSLKIHKQNLRKKCSTQNSYLLCRILEINNLPVEKLLRITNDDIKLFTDLMTLTNEESQATASIIPLEFIDNLWSHFYCKLSAENCQSLMDSGPLTHPVYFFLVKSLRDLIEDIISKSTTIAQELFKKVAKEYVIKKNISWSLNCPANLSLEKQYNLVYDLMKHFEPGNYTHKKQFKYKFALLENVDDSSFWSAIKGLVVKNRNDLFNMPEERLVWLYVVDAGIAPILLGESNERFRKLSLALLTGFLKFVQNAKHIRYESFRIAAHNIVKFAAQILPYFKVTNVVSQELDHSILDKQIDFIDGILALEEGDVISNLFSNLMEVYIEYWELRESIIGKLKVPCSIFKGLVDDIMLKILEIVDSTLSKQVELRLVLQYFRLFNEFVKHFKGINFPWFISKNSYLEDMKDYVKEIKKGEKITYEVSDTEKFLDILREKDKVVPKHFLIETVLELLKIINTSLNKADWTDESRLKAAGDLFLAIGHTFAHFEDQTDYTDIELFKRDCTTPFKSVIDNSLTYSDFKIRLDNVENYYLYSRKQNQIGIAAALDLCVKEVQKAQENGFQTNVDRKILEECFNRYSEKLALLQNLDIPAIAEDLKEQLKKVDVLPFERWTPHFKQTVLPVLLADLAAIWTILESKDVANIEKRIEPHCIQIICVLRLVGADYPQNGVPKHFAQVLTGQGKSIILGLLSSLIALTGHKANIVCYSKYLAVRDQNAFDPFFETFDALIPNSKISYYTFDNMAEDVLTRKINEKKVSLRTVVNDLILNKLETKTIDKVENPADSVLLIDEADVFFSENFYGQTYNPCSTIGMAALREIQPKLWEIVEGGVYDKNIVLERIREFINELLKDEKYEDFKNFLSCTSALFEANLDKMVSAAITVSKEKNNPDSWFVQKYKIDYNGIVCYRERLGFYSSSTYIGYNNVFNYFRLKKSNYDDKDFQNFGYLFIIWGYISYANLPLAYKNILGVSGTLMNLNDHEKNAIKKYGIETMSAMPSFFGDRKLKFVPSEHLTIQDSVSSWHSKIFDHISNIVQAKRAVLVFFDTDSEMKEFENKYRNNINRLYTLVGNEEPETIEWRINEAGVAQTVTLASRAMGRGIDYKSNDRSVEDLGGIHAIQTFFSWDGKEETQIQGRVARKDNEGSYELILCREHLKEIGCNEKSDGTLITTYQELCDARLVKANAKGATIEAKIRESEKEHNLTMAFLKSLTKYTPKEREMYFSKYPFTKLE